MKNRKFATYSPWGAVISFASVSLYGLFSLDSWTSWVLAGLFVCLQFTCFYFLASYFKHAKFGEWFRGALFGLNAGLNAGLTYMLTDNFFVSACIGFVLILGSSLYISRARFYHSVLGWLNLWLPMSWLINLVGLGYLLSSMGFGLVKLLLGKGEKDMYFRLSLEPYTASIIVESNLLNPPGGFKGFNLGNFTFLLPGSKYLIEHEIGHMLSLASMGSVFHIIGGIDEACIQLRYWEAYAEYLAESYNLPTRSALSIWR